MMPFYAALARGPDHVLELVTEPLKALWGGRDPVGRAHEEAYPELGKEHYEAWDRVYQTGEPFFAQAIEAVVDQGHSIEKKYFDLSLLPRFAADGKVEGVAVFALDVTDRRTREAKLQRRSAMEERLVGIVSHDLRTPLSAVLFGVQTLLRRSDVPDDSVRTLLRMQSSAERAVRMVRDLLDFTQARLGGGIQVRRELCNLQDVCVRVVEELRMSHPDRNIDLHPQGEANASWDPDRMTQVFGNLISNALKYSPAKTPITVTTRGHPDSVMIEVHNQGVPIRAEFHARLFEPLEQAGVAPGQARSIGLGLYIVKHIVEAHGGSIEFSSTEAAGTSFRVQLPKL